VKLTDVRHALITAHAAIARAPTDLKPEAVQFEAKASCSIEGIDDEETVGNCLQAIEASCHMAPIGNFENVRQLHSVLMCNEPAIAGRIRDGIVWIGGFSLEAAGFIPPTPTYIDQCLTDHFGYLDAAANELALVQDVVTRLAISHAHFEAIHPFRDGNGRIGRILMVRFLFDLTGVWLPLSVGIARDTRGYFDGLACAQRRGDHSLLVRVLAKAIEQSTG
jgi:Fic family protein